MSAIRAAMYTHAPTWVNEPQASFMSDKNMKEAAHMDDGPFETMSTLPTIKSISESVKDEDEIVSPVERQETVGTRQTRPPTPHEHPRPSRHSSSASVRSILSPAEVNSDTIIIRRCLPSARGQVDLGLQDVISDQCVAARSHAAVHEGGLFQAPHISRSSTSKSNSSALSMKKLKKHESVRVARRSYYEPDIKEMSRPTYSLRAKSVSRASLKQPQALSITSTSSDGYSEMMNSGNRPQSPPYTSYSLDFNLTNSTDASPLLDIPFPKSTRRFSTASSPNERPSTSKPRRSSIYGSVRSLFLTRPPDVPSREPSLTMHSNHSSSSLFKRWAKKTHNRANSAPTTTEGPESPQPDPDPPQYLDSSPVLPELGFDGAPLRLIASPTSASTS